MKNESLPPPKKKYDLSIVEFLDYVTAHSQEERPLFSVQDIARFTEIAGTPPKTKEESVANREHFRLMPHTGIKDLLEAVWTARNKVYSAERAA